MALGIAMPASPAGTEYDDDALNALFKTVGFIVVQWGQSEQSLDLATAILYQKLGGKQCAKRLPKMLEAKLDFLTKCLSQLPVLAALKTEGETLVSKFRKLSNQRHDFIHGAIARVSAEDGGFTFAELDIEDDIHVVRSVRLEGSEFSALTRELLELGAHATEFARRLWELAPK